MPKTFDKIFHANEIPVTLEEQAEWKTPLAAARSLHRRRAADARPEQAGNYQIRKRSRPKRP
jgi:hypothetical protein